VVGGVSCSGLAWASRFRLLRREEWRWIWEWWSPVER
jgi:hypothetical protein